MPPGLSSRAWVRAQFHPPTAVQQTCLCQQIRADSRRAAAR